MGFLERFIHIYLAGQSSLLYETQAFIPTYTIAHKSEFSCDNS
jgi:hypothetical protein